MKHCEGILPLALLTALACVSFFPGFGWGQVPNAPRTLSFGIFDEAHTPDGLDSDVFIMNPGESGSDLCANIYIFTPDAQMVECCSCPVKLNGLLTLSLNDDLTANPLTGVLPTRGTIKIISSAGTNCDPRLINPKPTLTTEAKKKKKRPKPSPGGGGGGIHKLLDAMTPKLDDDEEASTEEIGKLGNQCSLIFAGGGGRGICSCGSPPGPVSLR